MREAVVTFFFLGHLPKIPGTWGSAGAAACYVAYWLAARHVPGLEAVWFDVLLAAAVLVTAGVGVALGPWAERRFERKDPGPFVLDEVAGQWLSLIAIPIATPVPHRQPLQSLAPSVLGKPP